MPLFPSTVPQPQNCSSISNQGSILLVGNLLNCADEPDILTITNSTAAAIDAVTLSLRSNATITQGAPTLRKGSILHFGTLKAVVTDDTVIPVGTTAVPVPVEKLNAAIASNATAQTWALLRVLAPQTLPINEESSTTDTTDLTNGLQGSEVVTKLMLNPSVQVINRFDDKAVNDVIRKAAKVGGTIYTAFALSDTSHLFGRAVVSGFNVEFAQSDISKPTFNLLMQSPYFSYTMFRYESTDNQLVINDARKLGGLDVLV
jgi:hypothetical protein